MSEYRIGVDHADLDWIYNQLPADGLNRMPDPRSDPMEYSQPTKLGDGSVRGLGWLQQVWHWVIMTETQCETLRGHIGSVNVYTRKNDGTFGEYTGTLVWPDREPEHYQDHVLDVSVTIIKLVAV